MNFKFEDLEDWEIALPPMHEQEEVAAFIGRQSSVIAGADLLLEHYEAHPAGLSDYDAQPLATVVSDIQNGLYKPGSDYGEGTPILRIDDFATGDVINETGQLKLVRAIKTEASRFALRPGDIVLNRVNSLAHVGKVALVGELPGPAVYESNMMRLRVDTERVLPAFVFRLLASPAIAQQLKAKAKQAVNQFSVNQGDVGEVLIPIPPREVQERIVREVELELVTLRRLSEISKHAKAAITQSLDRIWES
jgi:type I restriction enzyme S subunit